MGGANLSVVIFHCTRVLLSGTRTVVRGGASLSSTASLVSLVERETNVPGMSETGCGARTGLERLLEERHHMRFTFRNLEESSVVH